MEFSISQIAQLINGEIEGNAEILINDFSKIEEGRSGCISFLANPKYETYIYTTESSAVIVANDFIPKSKVNTNLIRVADPYLSMSTLMGHYKKMTGVKKIGIQKNATIEDNTQIDPTAFIGAMTYISANCIIGKHTQIYPQVFVGENVSIGSNCIIYSGVKIYDGCIIGNSVTLHSGVIIGSDGFGFAPDSEGIFQEIPQLGIVEIENNVSIGANTTVDRATMGKTLIKKGAKIDNLVQIAHNVEIGENTVIAAQSGVAGSSKIGNNCIIGGQTAISGHLKIANGTKIGGLSGVTKSILSEGQSFAGRPLLPINDHLKMLVGLKRLNNKA